MVYLDYPVTKEYAFLNSLKPGDVFTFYTKMYSYSVYDDLETYLFRVRPGDGPSIMFLENLKTLGSIQPSRDEFLLKGYFCKEKQIGCVFLNIYDKELILTRL